MKSESHHSRLIDTEGLRSARPHIHSGEFNIALSLMVSDLKFFPDNLPLLANLASCYYMANNYLLFKKFTLDLLENFEGIRSHVALIDLRPSMLALVRLLEELGEIAIAARMLNDFDHNKIGAFDKHDKLLIAQKLRLFANFQVSKVTIEELYNQCRILNYKSHDVYVDIEGALLLADWSFFGEQAASERLNRFCSQENILDFQKRWLIFDHLFESMRSNSGQLFDDGWFSHVNYLEADPFERLLWDLYLNSKGQLPHAPINLTRIDELSPFGAIKMLAMLLSQKQFSSQGPAIKRKVGFLLNEVSQHSRALIMKVFPIEESQTTIEVHPGRIVVNGRDLALQKGKAIYKVLLELSRQNKLATDQAIQQFQGEEFDTNSYAKMRVLIARTNSFLLKNLGLSKALTITKDFIQLNQHVQIVRRV